MYCYCQELLDKAYEEGINGESITAFRKAFDDGTAYCYNWSFSQIGSSLLIYSVPMAITFVNFISKTILRLITRIEGR